jgi:hypothetical protein
MAEPFASGRSAMSEAFWQPSAEPIERAGMAARHGPERRDDAWSPAPRS